MAFINNYHIGMITALYESRLHFIDMLNVMNQQMDAQRAQLPDYLPRSI